MIAQYRPDIARAVEETVVNLKGLEQTLEILRNDLAWLAQSVGHPQAAQIALTPARALGIGQIANVGALPNLGNVGMVGQTPYATPFQTPNAVPNVGPIGTIGQVPYAAAIQTPFATPNVGVPTIATPFSGYPSVASPFAAYPNVSAPYGVPTPFNGAFAGLYR